MTSTQRRERDLFHLLTVCTGNICRSPVAERLLAVGLGPTVSVSSAGTHALVGEPIYGPMVPLIRAAGAEVDSFTARRLSEPVARSADLVLAMTRAHRAAVVEVWPAAVRRSFTLLEFARLLESVNPASLPSGSVPERLQASIPLAAAQRRQVSGPPDMDDVADPYGRGDADYVDAFGQIEGAVRTVVRILVPS